MKSALSVDLVKPVRGMKRTAPQGTVEGSLQSNFVPTIVVISTLVIRPMSQTLMHFVLSKRRRKHLTFV